jgi:hypothetical protein
MKSATVNARGPSAVNFSSRITRDRTHKPTRLMRRAGLRRKALPQSPRSRLKYSQHLQILRSGEDETGKRFVKLRIRVAGRVRIAVVPLDGFTTPQSPVFDVLNGRGAHLYSSAARLELINRLQANGYRPSRFTVATRLGWHGQDFVLPDRVISPTNRRINLYLDPERPERFDRYRIGGTYSGWQSAAKLIKGNSRLILGACVSLAGIIGPLLHTEPICIALVAEGETGKTSIGLFAGTFWGRHTDPNMASMLGFGLPWDSTDFDIEKEALAGNHTVVLLDESRAYSTDNSQVIAFVTRQVFRLGLGFERGRGTAGHRRRSTHVSMLATSNISIENAPRSVTIDDAVRGRWIEVPAPENGHGMFENLHEEPDILCFTDRLRTLASRHFGHAARKFITRVSEWLASDRADFLRWAEQRRQYFLECAAKTDSPGRSVARIRQKFATLYIAGCLATEFNILPLNRRAVCRALLTCYKDHLTHVAREQQKSVRSLPSVLDQLRNYVTMNPPKDLRKRLLSNIDDYDIARSSGLLLHNAKRGDEFCTSNTQLEEVVGGKVRARELKHALERTGDIATEQGVGDARFSVKRTIAKPARKNRHRPNLIAIKASALGLYCRPAST